MNLLTLIAIGITLLAIGSIAGYFARQSILKRRKGTIEQKLHRKVEETRKEGKEIISKAKEKADKIIEQAMKETESRRSELLKTERLLYKREHKLEEKISNFEEREEEFRKKLKKLKEIKEELIKEREKVRKDLRKIANLSEAEAKKKLMEEVERESEQEILGRIRKLERDGEERFEEKAREILTEAIERYAAPQVQDITTASIPLSSDNIKGRIIGKEGRNIRTFEKLTGAEVLVDDTPETVVISCFNPIRRQVAKTAMESLIKDGRIQPARIEEHVEKAKEKISKQIEEFGKNAVYEVGIIDMPDGLVRLLGRLHFRTSYGQSVLMHSLEVAHLSAYLAAELGGDVKVAKRAGLLHDIGKAIDDEVGGSHVDIGIKILEKFGEDEEVIDAMKAHHGEYRSESLEAVIVKVADQISGARPGARKDTVENYLKRLEELEGIAKSFKGVKKVYAVQAGREVRVFVKPEEVGDLEAYKIAKDIASRIHQELNYPGEIKVNVIRETRVTEYAR